MLSGKADIQSTNPPAKLKPNIVAISELHKPQKGAESEPREHQNHSGFQEHGLRLRELSDWIEGEYRLREADSVVVDAGIGGNAGIGRKESAGVSVGI